MGLHRTSPSPNFVELQTINFWKNRALLSGCHPCCLSAAGAAQLPAEPLVHRGDAGWASPEWERGVHSPWGCSAISSVAGHGGTGAQCDVLCTGLGTGGVCAEPASAAQLLAAREAGAALPACVPWAKLSFSSFGFFPCFPSSFHRPRIQLADLVPCSTFLAEMWCLQIKYTMNTMKMCSICQI